MIKELELDINPEISASDVKNYKAGQIIVSEGDQSECFYVILKGNVEITQNSKTVRILKEGDVFGLENFFLKRSYTTSARTLIPARIATYSSSLIDDIIYTKPQMVKIIFKSVMAQLEQTTEVAEENIAWESLFDLNERIYRDGDVVIEEGTYGSDFYQLLEVEGGLLVTREGKEIGRIMESGEYFGEMSSILQEKRTATVTSVGRNIVCKFSGENLGEILELFPNLAKKIIETLAPRLTEANKKLVEAGQEAVG